MRMFNNLLVRDKKKIFYKEPNHITKSTPKKYLSLALGANLYMPALKKEILDIILRKKYKHLTSMTICLEDSIPEEKVEEAEENLVKTLNTFLEYINKGKCNEKELPLIFIRVRSVEQFKKLANKRNIFHSLTGVVFPKFDSSNGQEYLNILKEINMDMPHRLYAMPILESKNIAYKETRLEELLNIKKLLDANKDYILNIRIGGTDLQGLYSIRRQIENSIYDIGVIKDCIEDIINVFSRAEDEYIISGPVWEYFDSNEKKAIDGLVKEIELDKVNSIIGKTVIHPSQISVVNALYVVTKEEYEDAKAIAESSEKGVYKSSYNNKMNEISPHLNWANKILKRAYVYGVFNEDISYIDLLYKGGANGEYI